MTSFILLSAVLLLCAAVCAGHESDLLVLTTADRLREEIRSELNKTKIFTCDPELNNAKVCNCDPLNCTEDLVAAIEKQVTETVKEAVSKAVRDLLLFEFSHMITPGFTPSLPASSCKEILQLAPGSPSGLYWIRGTDNGPQHMYCDMERSCKGVGGGWMRVASIDMTDPSSTCPSGLRTLQSPRRRCGMNINGAGCSSAVFPVQGVQYSQVCGKVIGYQDKTAEAFHERGIDSHYVDGISLTHGRHPYKHIWTFAIALHEHNSGALWVCPCTNTRNAPLPAVPGFVGQDYFCDTGSENRYQYIFYEANPLWDGRGCGQYSTCCSFNSPPWFKKEISPTTDDIEMRLCSDQARDNEDVNFEILEIYVQ